MWSPTAHTSEQVGPVGQPTDIPQHRSTTLVRKLFSDGRKLSWPKHTLGQGCLQMRFKPATWHPTNPARNLAGARLSQISERWLDSGFAGTKI